MPIEDRRAFRSQYFQRMITKRCSSKIEHWAIDYFKKNPIKSCSAIATTYGLLTIFSYHFHIEYFPVFDIKALASIIFAAAYTGFAIFVVFSLGLFIPCYFVWAFCIDRDPQVTSKDIQRRIFGVFFVAGMAFVGLCAAIIIISTYEWPFWSVFLLFPAFWFIYLLGGMSRSAIREMRTIAGERARNEEHRRSEKRVFFKALTRAFYEKYKKRISLGTNVAVVCFMQFFSILLFFAVLKDSPHAHKEPTDWITIGITVLWAGTIIAIVSGYLLYSWCVPGTPQKHRASSVLMMHATPFLISFICNDPSFFFAASAFITKIGGFKATEMTLTDIGCKGIAEKTGALCTRLPDGTNKICGVYVMSRLGVESYLLISYPHKDVAKDTDNKEEKNSKEAGKRKGEAAANKPAWVKDIYLPSKEILTTKPDLESRFFRKEVIVENLAKSVSQCVEEPTPPLIESKISTFRESELFEYDKFALTERGKKTLTEFATRLVTKNGNVTSIQVVGHADQIGSAYHNMSLSQLRAINVANYLQERLDGKITNLTLQSSGMGSTRPKKPEVECPISMPRNRRIDCFAENRRVDITVTSEKK